jgi:hypothetical protein
VFGEVLCTSGICAASGAWQNDPGQWRAVGYSRACKIAVEQMHPQVPKVSGPSLSDEDHGPGSAMVTRSPMLIMAEMFNMRNGCMLRKIDRRFTAHEDTVAVKRGHDAMAHAGAFGGGT